MSQIEELRRIIVGDNSEQLAELRARIEDIQSRTRDVAEVIAPAISERIKQDDELIDVLKYPISDSLKQMIRAEPAEYAEALYPAISPSIRLAISQAISSLLTTINQTMESATTLSGIRTRFESMRTGIPYAELLLRKSLLYRVEHIYLIDRDTGILIAECASQGNSSLDSDAVSGMFSAIQSFVQDSFSGKESDRLTDFKVGTHTIWIAHGPKVMLACVIMGDAPESLKNQLYASLDKIRVDYAAQISTFDGDVSGFDGIQKALQPLLKLRLKDDQPDVGNISLASKMLIAAIIGFSVYLFIQWFDKHNKLSVARHYLNQTPGLIVTSALWEDDKIIVNGMQDPDAKLPLVLLGEHDVGADKLELRMTQFRSLETDMEVARFANELRLPEQLKLVADNGQPTLLGNAPIVWLLENDSRLNQLASDRRLNIDKLMVSKRSLEVYLQQLIENEFGAPQSESNVMARAKFYEGMADMVLDRSWKNVAVQLLVPANVLDQYLQFWDQFES